MQSRRHVALDFRSDGSDRWARLMAYAKVVFAYQRIHPRSLSATAC
jgi:hypothetical protein